MVDGAAFAHRSNQSKGLAVSSSKLARSTASRPVPVGDSVPNSAGSNRRAPDCPNSGSVPHTPATSGFLRGLPPEPARAVRIHGPHTRPLPAANATEIDPRAAVLDHRWAAAPEAVARPVRPSALAVADTRDPSAGHWAASIPTTRTPFARSPSPPGRYSHAPPHAATPTPAPRTGDHRSATKRVDSSALLAAKDP